MSQESVPGNMARKRVYDQILDEFLRDGIDLEEFYGNPSYFGTNDEGVRVAHAGRHPSLLHWPLREYKGGKELITRLEEEKLIIESILGAGVAKWVSPEFWHSTIFSPIHSSNPEVIARSETDFEWALSPALEFACPYDLIFKRILVTRNAGIKAIAYSSNDQVDRIRDELKSRVPQGSFSALIHISMGNILHQPEQSREEQLKEYSTQFRSARSVLGAVTVDFLSYAEYRGPFIDMSVAEISRKSLR